MILGAVGLITVAHATDASLQGDVKSFMTGSFPYESTLMPEDPWGQGTAFFRLKGLARGEGWRLEAHHAVVSFTQTAMEGGFGTGVGLQAPEAIDLSWEQEGDLTTRGRTDRLLAMVSVPHLDITMGRQAISFGAGLFFTPLDLVSPFSPATIDAEYKPGVDAMRLDGYWGMGGRATLVGAYAGDWTLEESIIAGYAQTTVGVTDLGLFLGEIYADEVVGVSVMSAIRAVGIHGDASYTIPADKDEDPFVRAVIGAVAQPLGGTSISGELYLQTNGAEDTDEYLTLFQSDRIARGELWTVGRTYGALSVAQEITPLISGTVFGIINLGDKSALLGPAISWSVADDATLSTGAYVGLGERPEMRLFTPVIHSELGMIPTTVYLSMASYF